MPKNCDTCKYDLFRLCGEEDKTPCDDCYNGNPPTKWEPGENYEPQTNADRIRAMDDELLATQLVQVFKEGVMALTKVELPNELLDKIRSCFLEKLQQPAEGE
jgi:molybdopterin/thiamine biosynthesis adenylyltransferase